MQGLAELEHHIVGRVHHVVDGTGTRAAEPLLQPRRGRRNPDVADDGAEVARAQVLVVDPDGYVPQPNFGRASFEG